MLAVGHNRRFWPSMRALRDIARKRRTRHDPPCRGPQQQRELAEDHRGLAAVAGGIAGRRTDRRRPACARRLCQHARPGARRSMRSCTRARPGRRRSIPPCWRSILPVASPARWRRSARRRFTGAFMCSARKGSAEVLDETTLVLRKVRQRAAAAHLSGDRCARAPNSTPSPTRSRTSSPFPVPESRRAGDAVGVRGGAAVDAVGTAGAVRWPAWPQEEQRKSSRYRDIATELQKEIRLGSYAGRRICCRPRPN